MTEDGASTRIENENTAADGAFVGEQIGVQFRDFDRVERVVVHNKNTYTVSPGDTAERKHEVALNNLKGGVPRRAEEQFGELVFGGECTTERIYYYVLAVISDRGFSDLAVEAVTGISGAWKLCADLPRDSWTHALDVARSLLDHLRSNSSDASFTAVAAFSELPADRQDEISAHLAQLLDGFIEQQLDAKRKHAVDVERLSGRRIDRAWKFFEPDPTPPTRYEPSVMQSTADKLKPAVIGSVVAGLAFVSLFLGSLVLPFWGGLLLLVTGCSVALRHSIPQAAHQLYIERRREPAESPRDGDGVPSAADKIIERCFREACPEYAQDWPQYAAAYRARLHRRFSIQLRDGDQDAAKKLKWLFEWHAGRVAQQWPYHDPHVLPDPSSPSAGWRRVVGVVAAMVGLLLLAAAHRCQVVPLVLGGWFALPAVLEFSAGRRAALLLRTEAHALFDAETAEYDRWLKKLGDRPDDIEMARWLALDKAHLKAEALRRGGIAENGLVSHVVIAKLAPGAQRGAVLNGPPRYTKYHVTIILLTRHGVRVSRVYLVFTTGEYKNEEWVVFGYDRISSASLSVKESTSATGSGEPVRRARRDFRLRLVDGTEIMKINDSPSLAGDADAVDEAELARLAAETSGMDAALPVLEAVAHHGREWIDLERNRWSLLPPNWLG